MKVVMEWKDHMYFEGKGPSGHVVGVDAAESVGGSNRAARPMELLLNGLGGCTSIDILSILNKMRLTPASFHLEIDGERAEEHPKRFTKIHIHYFLEGENLTEDKVRRAVQLSMEKYCSAAHSLNAEITASFEINGVRYSMN
ncbi:OsmC family protein [Thermicanus aegyptius]|uniref:OsmC family protein n=1 Tax=Thermicanus aegyptius TaxID=94009 RepID=UPI00048F64CB|nr:OsmC family protein [Thermicanus aegyptius]